MKKWVFHVATFLLGVAVVGVIVVVAGLVPIKASSGHWAITEWLLSFSMSRSVATHSIGIESPDNLDSTAMVMKGAGHFEVGCALCHGSPARRLPRITQQLTAPPPSLSTKIPNWSPSELFYITKHGVRFTGMPAFPSQHRDDEVWAIVSFLLKLPELDERSYLDLVFVREAEAPNEVPQTVVELCAHCHGFDGRGRGAVDFPDLTNLHKDYFVATMQAYADGSRHSGIMEPIAARLSDDEIRETADYYLSPTAEKELAIAEPDASNKIASKVTTEIDSAVSRGEIIARDGLPDQDVGACVACHQLTHADHNPNYPNLVGQSTDYLSLQLDLMRERHRGGSEFIELMHPVADGLKSNQAQDVAAFYSSINTASQGRGNSE